VIDQPVAECGIQVAFGDGEAHRIGDALAERAGRGLDALGVAEFRVARRLRAELTEGLEIVERHVPVAQKMQQRIEQHRAMAGGEDEAVAVGPCGVGGIEFHELGEQHGGHVGGAHRQARMAGIGFLDRIHAQCADGVGHQAGLLGRIRRHAGGSSSLSGTAPVITAWCRESIGTVPCVRLAGTHPRTLRN